MLKKIRKAVSRSPVARALTTAVAAPLAPVAAVAAPVLAQGGALSRVFGGGQKATPQAPAVPAAPVAPTDPVPVMQRPEFQQTMDQMTKARETDMATGRAIAEKEFGRGNADMASIIAQREAMARGLASPEFEALRARGMEGINSSMQTGMRALQAANSRAGVRGGAAVAGAMNIAGDAMRRRQGLENDLVAQDIALRRQGLDALESTITGERAGALSLPMAYAQLGSTDRGNAANQVFTQDMVQRGNEGVAAANAQRPGPSWDARFASNVSRFTDPTRRDSVFRRLFGM